MDAKRNKIDSRNISEMRPLLLGGLKNLNEMERKAIFLRFWPPYSIAQVADELKVTWDHADEIINRAIEKLRRHFVKNKFCVSNSGGPHEAINK